MTEAYLVGALRFTAADHESHGRSNLNPLAVELGGKDAGIRLAVRRDLSGFVFVAVEAVNPDVIERLQVALTHAGVRKTVQPGIVGNEANDTLPGFFDDPPLGHAVEADVEFVKPLPLRRGRLLRGLVSEGEIPLFLNAGDPSKTVIRWIS